MEREQNLTTNVSRGITKHAAKSWRKGKNWVFEDAVIFRLRSDSLGMSIALKLPTLNTALHRLIGDMRIIVTAIEYHIEVTLSQQYVTGDKLR